jgi:hypothetical protein
MNRVIFLRIGQRDRVPLALVREVLRTLAIRPQYFE